ncbi:MAG: hypothetical protein R3C03_14590 [Pirellulaceae bacterium]
MLAEKTIRIVSRETDGSLRVKDFECLDDVAPLYDQAGIDDCNTELSLRGYPVFRGLIGPIAEGKRFARYETPSVFEALTKEWAQTKTKRRRGKSAIPAMHFPVMDATPMAADYV